MQRDLPRWEKTELFERLARGHEARITVVTPNARLAQALGSEFAQFQRARGLAAWETADILPFGGLVSRLWEDALYSDLAAGIPALLSEAQEQVLWEDAIHAARHSLPPFSAAPAAERCRGSWQLVHAWRLALDAEHAANEDARAFLDWSSRYERATRERRHTDTARLPDVVAAHLAHAALRKPATLVLFGVDIVTPQMRAFLDAIAAQGCAVTESAPPLAKADLKRVELTDAKDEIETAARWARSRLVTPAPDKSIRGQAASGVRSPRIGIVVPDLAAARARVQRIFANVMCPDHLVAAEAPALPFNISLGRALAEYPMIADALLVIDLAEQVADFEHASRVIRSPFIAGADTEMEARARLDAWLRKRCAPGVSLDSLARLADSPRAPRAPLLVERLKRLAEFRKASLFVPQLTSEWARAFSEALRIAGFPGERGLDSAEHQTLDKWHELLAELATLERVAPRMGFQAVRERLRTMARETVFQPQARDVPIQVMGVLESAAQQFDHLWVMGLTDDAWPLPARPDPFVSVGAQRAAGIPQADPVTSLELDRRITQGWIGAAREVVLSSARMRKESELAPSPLIASIVLSPPGELMVERYATLRGAIRAAAVIETVQDGEAPAVTETTRTGGTGLFKDQAACPFRAFAKRRLASEALEAPRHGLDLRDRGNLVHDMMRGVWSKLVTHENLVAMTDPALGALLGSCADEALCAMRRKRPEAMAGRYAVLERARLVRLALEWLLEDRKRAPFEVVAVEEKYPVTFGGITVDAKLDRMDQLAAGRAIIDYKTGVCSVSHWLGKRPEEPQLPMYALGRGEDVAAVAFAVVKTGGARYRGISRAPDLITGVNILEKSGKAAKRYRGDWDALLASWREELETLGRGFARGDARVDPKRLPDTCENCEQHALCRIAEKMPLDLGSEEEGEADE
jgi:probable DNA repair protein